MRNSILKTALLSTALFVSGNAYVMASDTTSVSSTDTTIEQTTQLSSLESASLQFMREEEKLARDVYLALYDVWGIPVFQNIADSEQTHTDAVAGLIAKYNITDPVTDETQGVFTDPHFTELYEALVAYGSESYENALRVGTEIEELDIADINEQIQIVDHQDIKDVYSNLLKGSRNHLRSFYSLVVEAGFEYIPTHISQEEFDAIVNSDYETGNINR